MSFLKPLQRTLGIVTLLLACLLSLCWARGLKNDEVLNFNLSRTNFAVRSYDGRIQFRRFGPSDGPEVLTWHSMPLQKVEREWEDQIAEDWARFNIVWRADFSNTLHVGTGMHKKIGNVRLDLCVIPYWSFVIPLTVLSAWLLLRKLSVQAKPQQTKQGITAESIAGVK